MMLDIPGLKLRIDALRRDFPEVFADEEFLLDVLEGQTDFMSALQFLDDALYDAEGMAEMIKSRITEQQMRLDRYERRATSLRGLMRELLETSGATKVQLPTATVSMRSVPPKVVITDEAAVPDTFFRIKREISKSAVADALKAGDPVPGATLSNGGQSLSIRRT
jgi:hypothetical protein